MDKAKTDIDILLKQKEKDLFAIQNNNSNINDNIFNELLGKMNTILTNQDEIKEFNSLLLKKINRIYATQDEIKDAIRY